MLKVWEDKATSLSRYEMPLMYAFEYQLQKKHMLLSPLFISLLPKGAWLAAVESLIPEHELAEAMSL